MFNTFEDAQREKIRRRGRAFLRHLIYDPSNKTLIGLCQAWGLEPIWLPNFRHALDSEATRGVIARYLLGEYDGNTQ